MSTRRPERSVFTETTFTASVLNMRINSVGGMVIQLNTDMADTTSAFKMNDAAGEELHFYVTRKAP